ncbi:unnamed protein product [Diatraea saccharalis]|uniref:Uncharacterized protein n=1 Tax=Diatraea saccharalis TaxID=40085 RepID=A0A9N9WHE6_9NEOP|nr:unnamed protein product [Diatraea saccharalis]
MKEEVAPPKASHSVPRSLRPEREKLLPPKRPSVIPKRVVHDTEIINKHEDLELQQNDLKEGAASDLNDTDSISSRNEKLTHLKIIWQEKIVEFEKIKNDLNDKQIKSLAKKIKEYAAENEMLSCSFEKVKNEFIIELNEIVSFIRKSVKDTMTLNLRNEQLICEVSDLNSQKSDLRKQLHEADYRRPSGIKNKVEDLEKQLKEEKCKNNLLRVQLNRASCQGKVNAEQISHIEAALEQSQSNCWALERTVQDLQEKNRKLQADFGLEFNKFTESIRENTAHLEEIAEAREKLQAEKEDLEKRLAELSTHYNESIKNMKKEINVKVEKIIETEMKYEDEKEERLKLIDKVESLCAQLLESELRYKDMVKQVQELELQLSNAAECRQELNITKHQLDIANTEIEKYRDRFIEQSEAIKEIENNFKESASLEENLKSDLKIKEEYIGELEKKVDLLEQQRQESENKMTAYEEQLSSLKNNLAQLQEDFGEFENLNELHEMVKQQRANLIEATRQNGELAEALQKKDIELEQCVETISEQEHIVEQRDEIIKMLSQKEEEHTNIIKLLRNNLEMRTQAEVDLNQDLSEKNAEIDNLINNLDTRKQQICELEKVILTLENQTRKLSAQRRKDQENIQSLETKLVEYETIYMEKKRNMETTSENLDSIIKKLELEINDTIETNSKNMESFFLDQTHVAGDRILTKRLHKHQLEQFNRNNDIFLTDGMIQNKPIADKCPKRDYKEIKHDLDRQKGITNIQNKKWMCSPEPNLNIYDSGTLETEESFNRKDYLTKNLHLSSLQQSRDDKKIKTFKFAAHRI